MIWFLHAKKKNRNIEIKSIELWLSVDEVKTAAGRCTCTAGVIVENMRGGLAWCARVRLWHLLPTVCMSNIARFMNNNISIYPGRPSFHAANARLQATARAFCDRTTHQLSAVMIKYSAPFSIVAPSIVRNLSPARRKCAFLSQAKSQYCSYARPCRQTMWSHETARILHKHQQAVDRETLMPLTDLKSVNGEAVLALHMPAKAFKCIQYCWSVWFCILLCWMH